MNERDISPLCPEPFEKPPIFQTISVKSIIKSKKIISKIPTELQIKEQIRANSKNSTRRVKLIPAKNKGSLFFKRCFWVCKSVCCFFCDIWGNKKKREETFKKINSKHYKLSILNFFTHLIWVLRAIKTFKNRTKYRNLKDHEKHVVNFVNDAVAFEENKRSNQRNWMTRMNFFSRIFKGNKLIRRLFRKLMRKIWHKKMEFQNCLKNFFEFVPTIQPNNRVKILWDFLIILIICLYFLIIPMQIGFDFFLDDEIKKLCSYAKIENLAKMFVLLPEIILATDSLLKFITGIYINGVIVNNKHVITEHYLKTGLIYDIMAYFPIFIQGFWRGFFPQVHEIYAKVLQLLMFCKLKRVSIAFSNFQEIVSSKGKHDYLLSSVSLFLSVFFIAHLNACAWHSLGFYYPNDSWLKSSGFYENPWIERYWISMYFSVGIMVNSTNTTRFSPQNMWEYVYLIFALLFSAGLFGYIIFSIKEILEIKWKKAKEYKEAIRIINGFMQNKNMSFELQSHVRKYLEFVMKKDINFEQEQEILNKLNKSLKNEVILQSKGKILFQSSFFSKNFSTEVIEALAPCLKKFTTCPEEFVYKRNSLSSDSLYILEEGVLEENANKVMNKSSYDLKILNQIKKGEVFGGYSFFTGHPRESSVISRSFCSILELKKQDFLNILKDHPKQYQWFCQQKDNILLYSLFPSIINCSLCKANTHLITHCPFLHYLADKDFLIKKIQFSQNQERMASIRNLFPKRKKRNCLSNITKIQQRAAEAQEQILDISVSSIEEINSEEREILPLFPADTREIIANQEDLRRKSNNSVFSEKKPDPEEKRKISLEGIEQSSQENKLNMEDFNNKPSSKEDDNKSIRKNSIFYRGKIGKKIINLPKASVIQSEKNLESERNSGLFDYDFEILREFESYYSHNNQQKVLAKLFQGRKMSLKKARKKHKQPTNVLKIPKI